MTTALDPGLAAALRDHGHAIRPVLEAPLVARLAARFATLGPGTEAPVYRTFTDDPRHQARSVDLELKAQLRSPVAALLPGHEIVLATFVNKAAHGPSIDWHQDWTFTDEREHRSVLLWIPLVDVDEDRGGLGVIPGSHLWTSGIRTSSLTREGPTVPHQEAMEAAAEFAPLPAGTAVVYDPATIHGSKPNRADRARPALIVITAPAGAPVLHFCEEESTVGYVVDEAFFTTREFESVPVGYPTIEPWAPPVTSEDFVAPLAALAAARRPPVQRS